MRQRITYLLPEGTRVQPDDIEVGKSDLDFAQAQDAAEERRITIGLTDLPQELQTFLEDFHELHIRIGSILNHAAYLPAVSRIPPGLHAFFTPRKPNGDTKLCSTLQQVIGDGIKCSDSSDSFSQPPILSERFSSSSSYQFYNSPFDLGTISQVLQTGVCNQVKDGSSLRSLCEILAQTDAAAYVDYDFDVISHAVTITIMWPPGKGRGKARSRTAVQKLDAEDRLEVGILIPEKPDEPEELSLGGFLTVVGDDDEPSATMFSFPARHHPLPTGDDTTFTATFQQPTGLHPKFDLTLPIKSLHQPKDSCALHGYWTLPSYLFIDRYQYSDELFLASQNLIALRALSGEQDLEAPDWAVNTWGSAALFELAHPKASDIDTNPDGNWTITIPTHLRYVKPNVTIEGKAPVPIGWPVVFWACEAEEGLKMATNPFDRVNLGYDGLFGPKTMFYHIPPAQNVDKLVELLWVPTLDPQSSGWVSVGTILAVLAGFGWVCWQLLKGGGKKDAAKKGEGKKKQ